MPLGRDLAEWWQRRRRFAEEWAFHRDMAVAEFESLGMSRRDARRLAAQRLGGRFAWRRPALRALRADCRALLHLLPLVRIRNSPLLVPALLLAVIASALIANPQRLQVVESFLVPRSAVRMVPLTPSGVIPFRLLWFTLWAFAALGSIRIAVAAGLDRHRRIWALGLATFVLLAVATHVLAATLLQILLAKRWAHDSLQGCALLLFPFAYVGWIFAALRVWFHDLQNRCPVCLRRFGMPECRGRVHDVLVAPLETESICLHGHGLNLESHWGRSFAPDR